MSKIEYSIAHQHDMNRFGLEEWPDRRVPWHPAKAPDMSNADTCIGNLRRCGYCGSMHPSDVADAIRKGAKFTWADFKYGWPHKAYGDGIPNPHAGLPESRAGTSRPPADEVAAGKWIELPTGRFDPNTGKPTTTWREAPRPAASRTWGKFYSVHLQDAAQEDRKLIEEHLCVAFDFTPDGRVAWRRISRFEQ